MSLLNEKGAGKTGCRLAPAASCAPSSAKNAQEENHRCSRIIRPSLRNGLTVYSALSPVTSSFLPPSLRGWNGISYPGWADDASAELGISNGCQDHTISPYASMPLVSRTLLIAHELPRSAISSAHDIAASIASRPTFRDDRPTRPSSSGRDAQTMLLICPTPQARVRAADWRDGQFAQSTHAQIARRAQSHAASNSGATASGSTGLRTIIARGALIRLTSV
jgi:hypothetical protein